MDELKVQARDAFTLCKEKGWNPAALTPAQNRWIAAALRSKRRLVKDGLKAVSSVVVTTVKLRVVSDEKAAANETVCRSNKCGKFAELTNGEPVCLGCQCSNKFLRAKWKDRAQSCVLEDPETKQLYWDNSKESFTIQEAPRIVGGDSNATGTGTPQ